MNVRGTHVVNVRGWPGLDDWRAPTTPSPYSDRLSDRVGLVVFSAAAAGSVPERLGLGAYLAVVGPSVLDGGVIVSDDLDPAAREEIGAWANEHSLDTTTGPRPWSVVTVSDFYEPHAGVFAERTYTGAGFCIGAELGRTFGLVADHCGARRAKNADSWEVWLPGWGVFGEKGWHRASPHRPALWLEARRVGWQVEFAPCDRDGEGKAAGKRVRGRMWRGAFIDLLSLAYALDGDRSASFAEHCQNLGIDAVELPTSLTVGADGADGVTRAVVTMHALALVLDDHAARWFTTSEDRAEGRGRLDLARTVSPGALAAQIPARLRLRPPAETFDLGEAEHSLWAETFHGGWCEADRRLLGLPFGCVSADVTACFPLVAHLLGWWDLLCAERVERRDVTAELQRTCERAVKDPKVVLEPALWRAFGATLVEVVPDGEPFPVEVEDDHRPDGRMELVPLLSPGRPWAFTWADVVAAAIRARRVPQIATATRLVPIGRQAGLRQRLAVLPGLVLRAETDPVGGLVRHRRKAKERGDQLVADELRVVVNSLVFGILSRFDTALRREGRRWVVGERPGPWTGLPIASSVTAGSRLLLAVFDRLVTDQGGLVAYRDTDSSIVVSMPTGGPSALPDGTEIQVLTWPQVDEIVGAFAPLSPAPWWPVWAVKREAEGEPLHALVFGPKRHNEFVVVGGEIRIVERTDAQLGGTYADPPEIRGREDDGHRVWSLAAVGREVTYAIDRGRRANDALRPVAPWDGDEMAFPTIRRLMVKTPEMARLLPDSLGPRPGTRYVTGLVDDLRPFESVPVALDPGGDLADWQSLFWCSSSDGCPLAVTTDPEDRGAVLLETLDVRAVRWSKPPSYRPIPAVTVDPQLVARRGHVSGVIDAELDGLGELPERRPFYADADRFAAVAAYARSLGKHAFARATGLPLKVAERSAAGRPISARNVELALRAFLTVPTGGVPTCESASCSEPVRRAGARFHSAECRKREADRRYRERRRVRASRSEDEA